MIGWSIIFVHSTQPAQTAQEYVMYLYFDAMDINFSFSPIKQMKLSPWSWWDPRTMFKISQNVIRFANQIRIVLMAFFSLISLTRFLGVIVELTESRIYFNGYILNFECWRIETCLHLHFITESRFTSDAFLIQ